MGCNIKSHHPHDIIDDICSGNAQLAENYKKKDISIKDGLATRRKKNDTCPHNDFWWCEKKVLRNSHLCFPSVSLSTAHPMHLESLLPTQALYCQSGLSKPLLATSTEVIGHITFKFRPVLIPENHDIVPIRNHNPRLTNWTHRTGEWRNNFSCYLSETMNLKHNSN